MTLKRSSKIIQTGTIRKLGCSFLLYTSLFARKAAATSEKSTKHQTKLFAFHSNYGSILHHLRHKARYWSKIVIFFIPPCIRRPLLSFELHLPSRGKNHTTNNFICKSVNIILKQIKIKVTTHKDILFVNVYRPIQA